MAYTAVPAAPFSGGLNLRDSYEVMQPSQAYDLLNVTFDTRGGVRSRDGYEQFAPQIGTLGADRYDSLSAFYKTDGTKHLVCGASDNLEVFTTSGSAASGGASSAPTASPHFFARFGGPTKTAIYAANGTDKLRYWDGSSWTSSSGSYAGKFVTVTPWDNRLLSARQTGTTGGNNPSTVRFSNPSDPDTWGADNWIDLTPGDGEGIMGMCSFDNYVFVFKQSRFFVIYGTSIAADGTPELSYRSVDAGRGLVAAQALCVGPEGVYFMAEDGIYRTNGGYPQKISGNIDPLFYGDIPVLYGGQQINFGAIDKVRLAYHNDQVFVSVPTGSSSTNNRILVYDPPGQWWTVWDIPADALTTFKVGSRPSLVFGYSTGDNVIGRLVEGRATDNSSAIQSHIKTAFMDFGDTNHKTIRESKVWGVGQVRFSLTDDFGTPSKQNAVNFGAVPLWADGTDADDDWGDGTTSDLWSSGTAVRPKLVRQGVRGAYISVELRNASYVTGSTPPAWAVSRIIHHVREQRLPQVTTLDGE